jgi:hypothetical protein
VVPLHFNHQYQSAQLLLEREKNVAQMELERQKSTAQIALEEKKSQHHIELQDKKAEFEYLGKFTDHSMKEDLKIQLQFADYMRSVALSSNLREIWSRYFDLLTEKYKRTETEINALKAKEKESTKEFAALANTKNLESAELMKQVQDIKNIQRDLYLLQQKLDKGRAEAEFFDFEALLRKAEVAKRAGHYEEQRDLLLQLSERAPASLRPYVLSSLASAFRSLQDFRSARLHMEKAVALSPRTGELLVNLAIMQKNDKQLDRALQSLYEARAISTGAAKLNIELIIAGYLIHNGQKEEGIRMFEAIKPQLLRDAFAINLAWFYAVADQKDNFYKDFERALQVNAERTLEWVDQEVDINKYRNEERFKSLLAKYRGQ